MQNKYAKSSLPCWKASYDDSEVLATNPDMVPVAKNGLNSLIERPQVPRYTRDQPDPADRAAEGALGQKPPAQALADAASQAKPLLQ